MVYKQRDLFQDAVAMTFNQTFQVDLPKQGKIAQILLIMSSSDVSGLGLTGGNWRLLDYIGDIQIIGNGSRVIKNLKAREHQYTGYLATGKTHQDTWRNYAANTQWCVVPITFGRRWDDPDYALDLAQWSQVTLKVANSATSSQFATNIALTAIVDYWRDAPAGAGRYMKSEVMQDWVPVAGATQYILLPTEGKLYRLMLHLRPGQDANGIEQTSFQNLADLIDFELKSKTLKVYYDSALRLAHLNWYDYPGEVITSGFAYVNNGKGFDVGIGRVLVAVQAAGTQTGAAATVVPTLDADRQSMTQVQYGFQTDVEDAFLARGQGYHDILTLPSAWGDSDDKVIDLAAQKQVSCDVRTRSTATVTGADNRLLMERPHTGNDVPA